MKGRLSLGSFVRLGLMTIVLFLASALASCASPAKSGEDGSDTSPPSPSVSLQAEEDSLQPFFVVDTGDPALDSRLVATLESFDPQGDLLWQCFDFASHEFIYEEGPEDPEGSWLSRFAANMFADGAGNCMQFASVFALLAQSCGFDAQAVVGEVLTHDKGWALHGWVEIRLDGGLYLCDPTMDNGLLRGGNWFMVSYSQAEASYRLDGQPCVVDTELPPSASASGSPSSNYSSSDSVPSASASPAHYDQVLDLASDGPVAEVLLRNESGLPITGLSLQKPGEEDFPYLAPVTGLRWESGETLLLRYDLPPATPIWTNIVLREYRDLQVSFDGISATLLHDLELTALNEGSLCFEQGIAYLEYRDTSARNQVCGFTEGRTSTWYAERARLFVAQAAASAGDLAGAPAASGAVTGQEDDTCIDDPVLR